MGGATPETPKKVEWVNNRGILGMKVRTDKGDGVITDIIDGDIGEITYEVTIRSPNSTNGLLEERIYDEDSKKIITVYKYWVEGNMIAVIPIKKL